MDVMASKEATPPPPLSPISALAAFDFGFEDRAKPQSPAFVPSRPAPPPPASSPGGSSPPAPVADRPPSTRDRRDGFSEASSDRMPPNPGPAVRPPIGPGWKNSILRGVVASTDRGEPSGRSFLEGPDNHSVLKTQRRERKKARGCFLSPASFLKRFKKSEFYSTTFGEGGNFSSARPAALSASHEGRWHYYGDRDGNAHVPMTGGYGDGRFDRR